MVVVIISHFSIFLSPLTYAVGAGRLWTSAAEMFFLLSGITFSVVRSKDVANNFSRVLTKTWRRALSLYLINFLVVLASLAIAFWLSARGHAYYMPASLPTDSFWQIMVNTLTLKYGFGWASFLMYYGLFLLVAPFALKALYSRAWIAVPLFSGSLFILSAWHPLAGSPYLFFFVWQVYFFMGMILGRFRLEILGRYYNLSNHTAKVLSAAVVSLTAIVLMLSALISFKSQTIAARIPHFGWFMAHQSQIDNYLQHNRAGLLRPFVSLLVLAGVYIVYQKNKNFLQARTGNFFNTIGQNSLTVFVAQALIIPLLAALPLPHNLVLLNIDITLVLVGLMWLAAQHASLFSHVKNSMSSLWVSLANLGYLMVSSTKNVIAKLNSPEIDY